MKEKLVFIGNGMAGMRAVEELLKLAPNQYDITVFGAEEHHHYNRILLSSVLSGEKDLAEIFLKDEEWHSDHDIALFRKHRIVNIDRQERRVTSDRGISAEYDRLVLATGSLPFIVPVPGSQLNGVVPFRSAEDVQIMLSAARYQQHAVIIGGGLLGLEAANGLLMQGMDVTVVHLRSTLLERQLDSFAADLLQSALESRGMKFIMPAETEAILGHDRVTGLRLKDGREIPADIVVMAAGIRPHTALAQECGLQCERGVVVNDCLQTSDPAIYAVGECVEHRGQVYGLVAPLFEQAKICAHHLANERSDMRYLGSTVSARLKVTGINVFSAGDFIGSQDTELILFKDPHAGIYKKLVLSDNCLQGAILYGDVADANWYSKLMLDQTDLSDIREHIVFGRAYIESCSE